MRSKLGLILLLFVLNFESVSNNIVGAGLVPARVITHKYVQLQNKSGQGQALSLQVNSQVNSSADFLFTYLKLDGVAVVKKHRRKRRLRYSRPRPKVERASDTGGSNSSGNAEPSGEPSEQPTMAAPAPAPPPVGARPGLGAPPKRSSAPKIKPPTVQIKPPTK
jgi:hypothetical protein